MVVDFMSILRRHTQRNFSLFENIQLTLLSVQYSCELYELDIVFDRYIKESMKKKVTEEDDLSIIRLR